MSLSFPRLFTQTIIQKINTTPSLRFYARWVQRNPAKVFLPFEPTSKPSLRKEKVINLDPGIITKPKENQRSGLLSTKPESIDNNCVSNEDSTKALQKKFKVVKSKREEKLKKRSFYLNQKKVFNDENEVIYEKLNENDGRISNLLVKLKSKKDRQNTGQILVEGWRMIVDGLEAKCKLKYIIFSRTEDLNNLRPFLPKTGVLLYKIPYKEIKLWSDVETSPGLLGIFEVPEPENVKQVTKPLPLNIICDNIRVPGNLGAILRVAVGAGCEKVFLSKGCVDLWDPKVIRSAAGAHFRLPIYPSVSWEEMPKYLKQDSSVLIADSNAKAICDDDDQMEFIDDLQEMHIPVLPYYGVQYQNMNHITLIIGGETEGISKESYSFAANKNGVRLNIPLQKGIDSLNTGMAAAVIVFEIRKQLLESWNIAKLESRASNVS